VLAAENQQEIGDPTSLPIQDYLDRCNLGYIQRAVATYHSDHYILAFPIDAATYPNAVVVYDLLTQSWCGQWTGWLPTCFAVRTDVGSYSKMIFGQSDGTVFQWLDDLSTQEEIPTSYQDNAVNIPTRILTRALTFNDPFSYKTGLHVEFEFDESITEFLTVQVILDKVPQAAVIAAPFSTLSALPIRLPLLIPFILPASPTLVRMSFDLQRYGTWRELQFFLTTTQDKLSMRSIRISGFMDTVRLQTQPGIRAA
jgi:hypothetical protein